MHRLRVGLDYLFGPSAWVHGRFVGNVSDVGDTIAPGWTKGGLVTLWLLLLGTTIASSALATWAIHGRRSGSDPRRGFEPLMIY